MLGSTTVIDLHHIGVGQTTGSHGLLLKTLDGILILGEIGLEKLNSANLIHDHMTSPIDLAHAAFPYGIQNLPAIKNAAGHAVRRLIKVLIVSEIFAHRL